MSRPFVEQCPSAVNTPASIGTHSHSSPTAAALRLRPGPPGTSRPPSNLPLCLTGTSSPFSSFPWMRAVRVAAAGHRCTACLGPRGPRLGSCSRAKVVASSVRVVGDGSGRMPDEFREEVGRYQVKALGDPAHSACVPSFSLTRLHQRHSIMWCGDSSHGSLEDSMVQTRGTLVMLPASAPHQPIPSDVGDAACLAPMRFGG